MCVLYSRLQRDQLSEHRRNAEHRQEGITRKMEEQSSQLQVNIIRKFRKHKIRIRAGAEQTAPGEHHNKILKVQDQDHSRSRADSSR
jgi:hypothetical protein